MRIYSWVEWDWEQLSFTARPPQRPSVCNGLSGFLSRLTINMAAILDLGSAIFLKWAPSVNFVEPWHPLQEAGIAHSLAINLLVGNFHSRLVCRRFHL